MSMGGSGGSGGGDDGDAVTAKVRVVHGRCTRQEPWLVHVAANINRACS